MCDPKPPPRQPPPKDGPGPRGFPDCYYTSRTLNSTFRYVRFIKKLRASEEEYRKGEEVKKKSERDKWIVDFFTKCDRSALINDVARRVDICMKAFEEDLKIKRQKLVALYEAEERENIRLFVTQAQAGTEALWQDKKDRLAFLLAKRQKEHEEKYKDTPLSKCVHVLPCVFKQRAREAALVQLYQMREKQSRKMAEIEFDKMWHEVAMRESDALAARMEQDAIERKRREVECKEYSDAETERKRLQREREKQILVEESKRYKAQWDEELRADEEAEKQRLQKQIQVGKDRQQMILEREAQLRKRKEDQKLVEDMWTKLGDMSLEDEKKKIAEIRQRERDLDDCNRRLICMKNELVAFEHQSDHLFVEEAKKEQQKTDAVRCKYKRWANDITQAARETQLAQIKERQAQKEELKKKLKDEEEYYKQLSDQLKQLIEYKKQRDREAQVRHKQCLVEQIEYNQLLKERARQEELEQRKKGQLAAQKYKEEIQSMLCRESYSEAVHPFTRQVRQGVKMRPTCPCSKPTYCKRDETEQNTENKD